MLNRDLVEFFYFWKYHYYFGVSAMVDKNKMVTVLKQGPLQSITTEKSSLMIIPKNQQGTLTTSHQQIMKQEN
jgi:hypothetical protein